MKTHTAPDGYIREKQKELRRARQTIAAKYAATLVIVLLLPVWLFGLAANPGPDAWEETEVQYQSISEEYVGFPTRLRHVVHTSDGRMFVFNERVASMEEIQKSITAQEHYTLVYSETVSGMRIIEGLWSDHEVLQSRTAAVQLWEQERRGLWSAILVTCLLEGLALLLIDRLWCKKDHAKLKHLKAHIKQREAAISGRTEGALYNDNA